MFRLYKSFAIIVLFLTLTLLFFGCELPPEPDLLFGDDFESGYNGWSVSGNWAITSENSNSPTHSLTDSPGTNYNNNWNYAVTSDLFDFSGYKNVQIRFSHYYNSEEDWDVGYLEYQLASGSWTVLKQYTGVLDNWERKTVMLPEECTTESIRFRFRLETDATNVHDGWHIDDFEIYGFPVS